MSKTQAIYDRDTRLTMQSRFWLVLLLLPLGLALWAGCIIWIGALADLLGSVPRGIIAYIVLMLVFHLWCFWGTARAQNAKYRKVFEESDEHTHDGNCHVCGETFRHSLGRDWYRWAFIGREAYECRHGTDKDVFYDRQAVRDALHT